jgi:hypothetical protein
MTVFLREHSMALLELRSRLDPNGVLSLSVSLGKSDANREVLVTVESVSEGAAKTDPAGWRALVHDLAGSIADPTFRRHAQGDFEDRGELFR